MVSEPVQSRESLIEELSPACEQEVISNIPDFTNLAIGQIQLQNSIEICAQILRSIQEPLMSMNTRLTRIEVANVKETYELNYRQLSTMSGSANNHEHSLAFQGQRLKIKRFNGEGDPVIWVTH